MAIVKDAISTGSISASSLTISHVISSGDNRLLVVGILGGSSDIITGVTYNGVAMTRVNVSNNGNSTAYLYYLLNPASGTHDIVISSSTSTFLAADAVSYTGVNQDVPTATVTNTSSTTNFCFDNITPPNDNSIHVGAFASDTFAISSMTNGTLIGTVLGESLPLLITPAGLHQLVANSSGTQNWATVGAAFAPFVSSNSPSLSPSASLSPSSSVSASPSLQPAADMILWLKADAITGKNDGDTLSTWNDSSGAGHNATGSGSANPAYKTNIINGLPVVRLDGTNGFQLGTSGTNESAFDLATSTIFAVAKRTAGSSLISKNTTSFTDGRRRKLQISLNGNFSFSSGSDSNSINISSTPSIFNIYTVITRGNSDHDLILNGIITNKTTTLQDSSFNDAQVEIGQAFSNGAERLTGDIAEIIVYNDALGVDDLNKVLNYLSDKYNISAPSSSASLSPSGSPSPSSSPSRSLSPSASQSPSASISPSGSSSASASKSQSPSSSVSPSISPSASQSPSASISPSSSGSASASASASPSPGMGNQFPNPSFETDTTGWGLDSDFTRTNEDAFDGSWSIKQVSAGGFKNFTTTNNSLNKIPVIAGGKYSLSFYYKLTITSGLSPNIEIHDDTPFAGNVIASATLTSAAVWTKKTISFTAPSTGYITFRLFNNQGTLTAFYDLFYLELTGISGSASVSPSSSVSPSASLSPSGSFSPSASISPSRSASASLSPSHSQSPSASISPSRSASASISPSNSLSPSASQSPSSSTSASPSFSAPTANFVQSIGGQFILNGQRLRGVAINHYNLIVSNLTKTQLDDFFNACVLQGIKVVRCWAFDTSTTGSLHQLVYPLGSNLLSNGDFEGGTTTGWTLPSDFTLSSVSSHGGTYAIKQNSSGGFNSLVSPTVPVSINTDYILTFWYNMTNSFSFPDVLRIYNADTNVQMFDEGFIGETHGQWIQKQVKFNSGSATNINVHLQNFGGGMVGYVDDFNVCLSTTPVLQTIESGYLQIDLVLKEARDRGIKLILSLMDSNEFNFNSKHTFVNWTNQIYPGANLTDNFPYSAFFTDSRCRDLYKQTYRDLIQRVNTLTGVTYSDDDTIFAIEMGNEIRYNAGDANINTINSSVLAAISLPGGWADVMSTYFKTIDSNHMVSFGDMAHTWQFASGDWVSNGTYYGVDYDLLTQLPNIDYLDFHLYPNQANGTQIHVFGVRFGFSSTTPTAEGFNAQILDYIAVAKRNGKPIIIGEYGYVREEVASNTIITQYPRVAGFTELFNTFFCNDGDLIAPWNGEVSDGGSYSINIAGTWNGNTTNLNFDDRPMCALFLAENTHIICPSPSISPSLSPSTSLSFSASASPSIALSLFTKQAILLLPGTNSDLATIYTEQEVINVSTKDGIGVDIQGSSPIYLIHQYKLRHINNYDAINIIIDVKTTALSLSSPVYIDIWNSRTSEWETIATEKNSILDEIFRIRGNVITNLSDYYQGSQNEITIRIYQNNPL